jgi:(p)ppGpp synthase/HD superfamily hydrolase
MDILLKAEMFATLKHSGQKRKYTGEDYIIHPKSVVNIIVVNSSHYTDDMLCAAWLHDTVEDTDTSLKEIEDSFGIIVSSYVSALTDNFNLSSRVERKNDTKKRMSLATSDIHTIKLADLIDNSYSILRYDSKFAITYIKEMKELLPYLSKGDKNLFAFATKIVDTF